MKSPEVGSLAFKMCLYFVKNKGAMLFADDIKSRWGFAQKGMSSSLAVARRDGWIATHRVPGDGLGYCAGPKLEGI